jgi:hypothetical protein
MSNITFTNFAATTLASGINNIVTSLTVATGTGTLFPTLAGAQYFYAVLADAATGTTREVIKVTARSTDTFTIVRAQDNTTGQTYITGDKIELRLTAAGIATLATTETAQTLAGVQTFSSQPIVSTLTASSAVASDASKGLVSVTNTGSGNNVLATSPTITGATLTTSIFNGTVGATTPSTGAFTTLTTTGTINLLTVGRGGGAVSTNTAVGASALAATATGAYNSAFGRLALTAVTSGASNTGIGEEALSTISTASDNTAVGASALYTSNGARNTAVGVGAAQATSSGIENTAIGHSALRLNTTASGNTAVGYQAFYTSNRTTDANAYNLGVGYQSGYGLTTGQYNTFVGGNAPGWLVTSGSKNTILGNYNGNQGGIDIRTSSNYVVLSDGSGNIVFYTAGSSGTPYSWGLPGSASIYQGAGITFPATQSASTDANTLDDYEEGTWTPTLAFGGGSTGIVYGGRVGNYIKVGSLITAQCAVDITNKGSSTGSASVSGFPFTVSGTFITIIGSQLVSWTGAGPCQLLLSSGTTASFYGIPNGVGLGWTALTNTDFANTSQFYFTMVYKV